jgi:hypothetical protein
VQKKDYWNAGLFPHRKPNAVTLAFYLLSDTSSRSVSLAREVGHLKMIRLLFA